MEKQKDLESLLESMTLDDLCGQLLCYYVPGRWNEAEFEEVVKTTLPGAIFVSNTSKETIKKYTDIVNKYTKVPVIVAADIENGPGCAIHGEPVLPHAMAWGACDDEKLIERAGEVTAQIARKNGVHWTFSPVVDININPDNPVTNIRAISDSAKQVAKIGAAYVRGLQKNDLLIAGCKHFPGDGVDDRNQHFCTTINSLSKEEWMKTFGYVYQTMFQAGARSVMAAHIALPAVDDAPNDILGPKPAILSEKLMTGLLKGELGFEGCIVSDALSMVGSCSMVDEKDLVVEFIKAGGDVALFPLPSDFTYLKQAVQEGKVSLERIQDAVRRILIMKQQARLFENQEKLMNEITVTEDFQAIADEIGEKSIKIVRNAQELLPLKLAKGAKILLINLQKPEEERNKNAYVRYLDVLEDELLKRGFEIETWVHPGAKMLKERMHEFDCILVNCKISSQDYPGGSLRTGWVQIAPFWRGVIFKHPCVVFTSFGDPYKLYEFPYLRTYVNTFSYSESTQRGFVKVLLGEVQEKGKSPVLLKSFFERDVE